MRSMKIRHALLGLSSLVAITACNAQEPAKTAPAAAAPAATPAANTDKPPVVNGVTIPQARIDFLLKQGTAQGQPDNPQLRQNIRDNLIVQEVISQEAAKKGLEKDGEVALQIDMARQNVLVRAYIQDYLKNNPVSDDTLKAEYDKIKAQMGDKEYKARHILVEKEEEAKDIIAKLKKGEKFEKLAEKSKDPGSKANGGDLGWAPPGNYVKPFSDAMIKLHKGKFTTEPVKSQFGYHVIQLEDSRDMKVPGFDEVKNNLRQRLQQQQIDKMIADLKAKAKIN
ncbi:MAG: peptidylprolyl isomerase [Sulfuricella sp.]|nr:peptidylprolyl isomerase [Sulfuricella sp.]